MSRYIDAERFKIWLSEKVKEGLVSFSSAETAASLLRYAPTADVAPVVHGRWKITHPYLELMCSKCGEIAEEKHRFCPKCGAKMDGKESEK